MTGHTLAVQRFDDFITKNYVVLKTMAQQVCWNSPNYQDILQDKLLMIRNRILLSGFTGSNYNGFIWMSLSNSYRLERRNLSRKPILSLPDDYDEVDLSGTSRQFHDDLEVLTRHTFKYLDEFYGEKSRILYLQFQNRETNSYAKLAKASGLELRTIKNLISKIRKDLKANLINYTVYHTAQEVYRPVKNYEGLYSISNKGNVKSDQTGELKNVFKGVTRLWKNGIRKSKSISQLQTGVFRPEDCITFNRIMIKK